MTGTGAVATAINGNKWRHRMKTSALGADASSDSAFAETSLSLVALAVTSRSETRIRWKAHFPLELRLRGFLPQPSALKANGLQTILTGRTRPLDQCPIHRPCSRLLPMRSLWNNV